MTRTPLSPARAGRDAALAFAAVAVLVTAFVQIGLTLPLVGNVGSALVAVLFLYVPVFVAWRRHEDLDDYGFHAAPVSRGVGIAAAAIIAIFPLFILGYYAFYEVACHSQALAHLVPRGMCAHYGGMRGLHSPRLTLFEIQTHQSLSAEFALGQLVVVALPEELFFRGLLLGLLERRFPPKRRFLGGGVGLALVLSALAFALVHFPKDGDPRALATFFPGLLFGWMRSATGSILASTLTHAGSNILIKVLELSLSR